MTKTIVLHYLTIKIAQKWLIWLKIWLIYAKNCDFLDYVVFAILYYHYIILHNKTNEKEINK